MNLPPMKRLHIPDFLEAVSRLQSRGKLAISKNNLLYLKIDDSYIHSLFPFLKEQDINSPDYFDEGEKTGLEGEQFIDLLNLLDFMETIGFFGKEGI